MKKYFTTTRYLVMAKLTIPFRYDYVGSFLRPASVKSARLLFKAEKLSRQELTAIENTEIEKLIKKQKDIGLHDITDGEFRRSYWHLDFFWGLNGIEETELSHGYFFHGEETAKGSIKLTGKITGENHPFVEWFKFVKQFEDEKTVAKQTFPAPAQLLAELFRKDNIENTTKIYPDINVLIEDIGAAYRTVIRELYEAGCRNIQVDDCTWGMFVDKGYWEARQNGNVSFEEEAKKYLLVNNLAFKDRPSDLTLTTHVCRGNYHSTYACSGPYDSIAPFLFANEDVDGFYLEFDDERSGSFEPLKYIPQGKKVVLGLITSKRAELEDKENIKKRIYEAAKYVPLENLFLSPQCGFASCEIGNKLTDEDQWNKLKLVIDIANEVWSEL